MPSVQQLSLSQQIYGILKRQITDRHLPPNAKLDINALAHELQVSRTPVVEALARLDTEGLVTRRNRVGTFVAPLNQLVYNELFEARNMVEQWVLGAALERITPKDVADLRAILQDAAVLLVGATDETFDYLKFTEYDANFHQRLVEAGGNKRIAEFYASLNSHLHIARTYSLRALQRSLEGQHEHEMILKAYANHDLEAAAEAQHYHMEKSHQNILRLLEEHKEL